MPARMPILWHYDHTELFRFAGNWHYSQQNNGLTRTASLVRNPPPGGFFIFTFDY